MSLTAKKDKDSQQQLDQQQQITLGNKIKLLLKKQVSHSFHNSYEGGKSIAILKIVTSKKEVIKEIQRYLLETFDLVPFDPYSGNHGTGMKCTITINISELKKEMIHKINEEYGRVFKKDTKVIVVKTIEPVKSEKTKFNFIKTASVMELPVNGKEENAEVSKTKSSDKFLISIFLNAVLKFEEMSQKSFVYKNDPTDDIKIIQCVDEKTAKLIEQALSWYVGNPKFVWKTDENEVWVEFSKRIPKEKLFVKTSFSMSPSKGASVEEVDSRLRRISFGSSPKVHLISEDTYMVEYVRNGFADKIFKSITSMGWKAEMRNKNTFLIYLDGEKLNSPVVVIEKKNDPATLSLKNEMQNEVETPVVIKNDFVPNKIYKSVEEYNMSAPPEPSAIPVVLSDEDALYEAKVLELKALRSNTRVFLKLPLEMQKKVNDILFQEEHIVDEALSLLSFFKK